MNMRTLAQRTALVAAVAVMSLWFAPSAFARVHIGVGIAVPGVSIGVGNCWRCGYWPAPPVYYYGPAYYAPAYPPVAYYPGPYYAPGPVYYGYRYYRPYYGHPGYYRRGRYYGHGHYGHGYHGGHYDRGHHR